MKRFDVIVRCEKDKDVNRYVSIIKKGIALFFLLKKNKLFGISECEIDQNENTKEVLIEVSW